MMSEIKKAGVEDIPVIQQLTYAIWPDAYGKILQPQQLEYMLQLIYSTEALLKQIQKSAHQFIIVYDDGLAVGFASYSPKNAGDNSIYRLHKLYVLRDQQGKGTGRNLLNYIIGEISEHGAVALELNVNRSNTALHFYNKLGFTILKEEDIDIGAGYYMNDYVMELRIQHL